MLTRHATKKYKNARPRPPTLWIWGTPWVIKTGRESIWGHHFLKLWGLVAQKAHWIRLWAPNASNLTKNIHTNMEKDKKNEVRASKSESKGLQILRTSTLRKHDNPNLQNSYKYIQKNSKAKRKRIEPLNTHLSKTSVKNTPEHEHFPLPIGTE